MVAKIIIGSRSVDIIEFIICGGLFNNNQPSVAVLLLIANHWG